MNYIICLAVASLLRPSVWLKFVLELRLGCLLEFLLWSANIVLSELISRPFSPTVPFRSFSRTSRFRSVAHCSLDFSSVPFPSRRALLARLSVRNVSVSSRIARSTSRLSRFPRVARCSLDFPSVTSPFRRALLARLPVCPLPPSALSALRSALHFCFCRVQCARRPSLLFGWVVLQTVYSVLCLVSFALGLFCVY